MAKFFQKNKTIHDENKLEIVSDKSPFAYVEAYKTLRTNMKFSFPQQPVQKAAAHKLHSGRGKEQRVD